MSHHTCPNCRTVFWSSSCGQATFSMDGLQLTGQPSTLADIFTLPVSQPANLVTGVLASNPNTRRCMQCNRSFQASMLLNGGLVTGAVGFKCPECADNLTGAIVVLVPQTPWK